MHKIAETYAHNNSVSYPHENRAAGRDAVPHPPGRRALLDALVARGALCSFSNAGVEVPIAFVPTATAAAAAAADALHPPGVFKTFFDHA